MMKKVRYYTVRKGRGYWQPTARMRAAGFFSVRCGEDGPEAWAKAEKWTAKWLAHKGAKLSEKKGPRAGYVYFLRHGDRVKIGFSEKPGQRMIELRTGGATVADSMIAVRATMADEARLHERFAMYRRHGEWFTLVEPLRRFIIRASMFGLLDTAESEAA